MAEEPPVTEVMNLDDDEEIIIDDDDDDFENEAKEV